MNDTRLRYLFFRYSEKNITADEREEFMALLLDEANEKQIGELIAELMGSHDASEGLSPETAEDILSAIFALDGREDRRVHALNPYPETIISTKRPDPLWIRMLAAACVGFILMFGGYYLKDRMGKSVARASFPTKIATPGLPGSNKATLMLGNGRRVDLETVSDGALAGQPEIRIDPRKGEVHYLGFATGQAQGKAGRNTLTTPYGGQYKLVLPDGSKAWLNAGSSIEFPSDFSDRVRQVSIKGEVYFEIASDKNKPFVVNVTDKLINGKEAQITVLGTHFNVCSYQNTPDIKTTLIEGSVKVNAGKDEKVLLPGQQASMAVGASRTGISVRQVDSESVIAWKDGRFEFNGNLEEIMQQIARWYNLEVVFQGTVAGKSFAGAISRKKNVSDVLKILELTGGVEFVTQGRTIIVKNAP